MCCQIKSASARYHIKNIIYEPFGIFNVIANRIFVVAFRCGTEYHIVAPFQYITAHIVYAERVRIQFSDFMGAKFWI